MTSKAVAKVVNIAEPVLTVEKINPLDAQKYLDTQNKNRPFSDTYAMRLAAAMQRREWRNNGEAIKFNVDGQLIDGQHRLTALIRSGSTQTFVVVRNLPNDVFDTLDLGKKRTAGDLFALMGKKYSSALAAACRFMNTLDTPRKDRQGNVQQHVTVKQHEEALRKHPALEPWVAAFTMSKSRRFMASHFPAVLCVAAEIHGPERATQFLEDISGGAKLAKTSPALALRERMIESKASKTMKIRPNVAAALTIKAINAYMAGRSMTKLGWRPGIDEFPEIE